MSIRIYPIDSGDDALRLWRVDTGPLQAVFLPSVGGRLLSLRAGAHEILWINPSLFDSDFRAITPRSLWTELDGTFASWTNVGGSKTWPAPQGWSGQGEWAGPPDEVLDAGEYSFEAQRHPGSGDVTITMTSGRDDRSGLAITREFTFHEGSASFSQRIVFTNAAQTPIRWAMWEVAQVDTAYAAECPVELAAVEVGGPSAQRVVDLGQYAGSHSAASGVGATVIAIESGVSKFGFPEADGRVWFRCEGRPRLELEIDIDEDAEYPDGGSRVEVWLQSPLAEPIAELSGLRPDAWLAELEVLSPLHTIPVSSSVTMSIRWSVGGD